MREILNIVTPGPLILADMTERPPLRVRNPHLTALMRSHGLRQRDVSALEYLSGDEWFGEESGCHPLHAEDAARINAAFEAAINGDIERLAKFHLYRYTMQDGFILLRAPTRTA
jgi:hypothetical protein